jgi:hypothetical protein
MSWNSFRTIGSGWIISSKGRDPSHFSLKSRGSGCREQISDIERVASGCRFTYVVMLYESAQRQSICLIVVVMELSSLLMRQSEMHKVL